MRVRQWDLAVHGLHGPFLVNGRQFLIDVHRRGAARVVTPCGRPIAAEDGTAFVWEVKEAMPMLGFKKWADVRSAAATGPACRLRWP